MESLKELYRIGPGPSSSHTIAIKRICESFMKRHPDCQKYDVTLYGSLSLTGKGHMTDQIIYKTLGEDKVNLIFSHEDVEHPNTIDIRSGDIFMRYYSTGGGAYQIKGENWVADKNVYPETSMQEIHDLCKENSWSLYDYVLNREENINKYLEEIFNQMISTVESGLNKEGRLPGPLEMHRIAKTLNEKAKLEDGPDKRNLLITSYAYSCSEENASGCYVTTAPTLGSCGVLPAVLYYYYHDLNTLKEKLIESLGVAGIYGNLIKTNASISGARGGCQAEIGTACAMAAAAISYIEDLSIGKTSYAAEMAIEHHLGLTCDPVGGYVLIPCIERNGVAALRAYDAYLYAKHIGGIRENMISFDMVVETMKYTGEKLVRELKETSLGGLAAVLKC